MDTLRQLQGLLRELFQLDLADLDFGIYRLLRLKGEEIEAFLDEQLPRRVDEAFEGIAAEERVAQEQEVGRLAERISSEIGAEALLPGGEVRPEYRQEKAKATQELIGEYEAAQRRLEAIRATDYQKAEVFNHLYAFFSRYYEDGDFIPRRRYGARDTYAVPYNGQEVFFHWANRDQHYVKTAERFRDYAFTVDSLSGPYCIHLGLSEATVAPDNTKGDRRFFYPQPGGGRWDEGSRTLHIPFHYRLPSKEEVARHGGNSKLQEALLQEALPAILTLSPEELLSGALAAPVDGAEGDDTPLLLHRLRHFVRRTTTDYFIHRNLEGFLKQELELYLKDQVLHLGDLEGDLESKRRTLRVVRQLGEEITAFLAQLENVQRRLFEKRKLVLSTEYLVPVKEVPRALWPEVVTNAQQLKAWQDLFAVRLPDELDNADAAQIERFLQDHPTLVVNTAYFDAEFNERLLAGFENLDEATDGLLVHAENYQALRLLTPRYAGSIKCIYIDPPYNTGSDEFLYKDRYRHSSWLAMMDERLRLARELLTEDGVIFISIDDTEAPRLWQLLDSIFGQENYLGSFVWKRRSSSAIGHKPLSLDHEYVLVYGKNGNQSILYGIARRERDYPYEDDRGSFASTDLTVGMTRHQRPGQYYPIRNPRTGVEYWPPEHRVWRFFPETMAKVIADDLVIWPDDSDGNMQRPRYKTYYDPERLKAKPVSSWIETASVNEPDLESDENEYAVEILMSGMNQEGGRILDRIFGHRAYPYPKPVSLVRSLVRAAAGGQEYVLDFFAGSGTTGHAVISLNREASGRRRFILADFADDFDTVLVPRIQKVAYAPEWEDGGPKRMPVEEEIAGTPRLVKVLRLEGYEDALHNLATEETLEREGPRAAAHRERLGTNAYRLSYLLRLPLEASASMLNLARLEHPFDYSIEVLSDEGSRRQTVDLVETFSWLYGLHVERLEQWTNEQDGRGYRAVKARRRDGRRTLVLWRDMAGLDPAAERAFLEARIEAEGSFDEVLINGDSAVPAVRSLDGLFKRLLEDGAA